MDLRDPPQPPLLELEQKEAPPINSIGFGGTTYHAVLTACVDPDSPLSAEEQARIRPMFHF